MSSGKAASARPGIARWSISAANDSTALDRYREGLGDWYAASDFDEAALPRFFTDNLVCRFGDYVVGRGRSIGQTLVRGVCEIRRSELNGIILLLDLAGMKGEIDGVSFSGCPGTVHLRDMSRPSAGRVSAVDAITIAMPREAAPTWLLEPRFHGARIDGAQAVGRALIHHLTALAGAAPRMAVEDGVASVQAAFTLAERAFTSSGRFAPDQTRALYAGLRTSAGALIDRNLNDRDLSVASLTGALGVSRATLFRAFAAEGGINVQIRRRRLQSARAALLDRVDRRPTVAEVAHMHGFVSESHFSRVFREAYGEAPGAVHSRPTGPAVSDQFEGDMRYDVVLGWIKGGQD